MLTAACHVVLGEGSCKIIGAATVACPAAATGHAGVGWPVYSSTQYAYLVRTPGIVGGEARSDGCRIRVRDIVAARDLGGLTPEEIAVNVYPELTLAQVYVALAYYEAHRDEIDRAVHNEARFVEQFLHDHPQLVRAVRPAKS